MSDNILDNEIKVIDFSKGIRAQEVYGNDLILQNQINNERLATAGIGISSGLVISIAEDNPFKIIVSNGSAIDSEGQLVYLKGSNIIIEKPILSSVREYVYAKNGTVKLKNKPYSPERDMPAQYCECVNNGVTIHYEDDINSSPIPVSSIDGYTVYADIDDNTRRVLVEYYTTNDRIDTIYIDNKYNLKVAQSVTSSSPSIYHPENCMYELGYAYVDHDYYSADCKHQIAKMTLRINTACRRNVYTDENNGLYLDGIPFDELSQIHMSEPENARENSFWYDMDSNKLMVYRRTDNFVYSNVINMHEEVSQVINTDVSYTDKKQLSVYVDLLKGDAVRLWRKLNEDQLEYFTDGLKESKQFKIGPDLNLGCNVRYSIDKYDGGLYWIPVNDTTSIPAMEYKIWAPDENGESFVEYKNGLEIGDMPKIPYSDLQTFLFKPMELQYHYTPYKNELSIVIDQVQLFNDQFIEITAEMILNTPELLDIAIKYGYTEEELKDYAKNYKELGLGFKLKNKLDEPAFIQANILHRIADAYLKNKFQRTATFTTEKTLNVSDCTVENNVIDIMTEAPYCYGEDQLDVFIDGYHIDKSSVIEVVANEYTGCFSNEFKVDMNNVSYISLQEGSKLTYRVLTNIYSYDHIQSLIEQALYDNKDFLNILKIFNGEGHKHKLEDIEGYENIASKEDISNLLNEIVSLKDRVASLENRVAELEKNSAGDAGDTVILSEEGDIKLSEQSEIMLEEKK